jgi:hypothetical protein
MKLNVNERLALMTVLPTEGNYATFSAIKKIREKLIFTEEEVQEFNIKQVDQQVFWDKNEEREIEFTPAGVSLIVQSLENLESEKKLTEQTFTLYEKFIGGQ